MSNKQLRREVAFLESRIDYNLHRMGMFKPEGVGRNPAIQNNLGTILVASFLGGALLGVATNEIDLERALPLLTGR